MCWLCLSLQPMSMACFWKPLLPLVFIEPKSADLSPGHCAHSIFYATWPGHEVVHGHMVVPTGGVWMNGLGFLALKSSSHRCLVMVWLWRWMVRPSCLLDDGQWILVNMDWSLLIRWTFCSSAGTWGTWALYLPLCSISGSWTDIFHFFPDLLNSQHSLHFVL